MKVLPAGPRSKDPTDTSSDLCTLAEALPVFQGQRWRCPYFYYCRFHHRCLVGLQTLWLAIETGFVVVVVVVVVVVWPVAVAAWQSRVTWDTPLRLTPSLLLARAERSQTIARHLVPRLCLCCWTSFGPNNQDRI